MGKRNRDPQADSFGYWLFRVHRAVHAAFTRRLAALGVTGAEWAVLGQVARGGVTPLALARHMSIDRAAVTRFVDHLEAKGLVRRARHPTDRRSTLVELTAAGKALLPKLVAASRATNREFLSLLPTADADALLAALRVLADRLPDQVFPVPNCQD